MKEDRPRGIRVRECGKVRSSDQDRERRRASNEGQNPQPGKEGGIKPTEYQVERWWKQELWVDKEGQNQSGVLKKKISERRERAC